MDSAALVGVNPSFNQGMKDNLMPTDKEVDIFFYPKGSGGGGSRVGGLPYA